MLCLDIKEKYFDRFFIDVLSIILIIFQLFENPFTVVHTLATADTRGRLKGEEVELLKKIKEVSKHLELYLS
jgi:hypothetical protein